MKIRITKATVGNVEGIYVESILSLGRDKDKNEQFADKPFSCKFYPFENADNTTADVLVWDHDGEHFGTLY